MVGQLEKLPLLREGWAVEAWVVGQLEKLLLLFERCEVAAVLVSCHHRNEQQRCGWSAERC